MFLRVHTAKGKEMLVNAGRVVFVQEGDHVTHLFVDVADPDGKPKVVSVREYLEDIWRQGNAVAADE